MENHLLDKGEQPSVQVCIMIKNAGDLVLLDILWLGKFNGDSAQYAPVIEVVSDNHKHLLCKLHLP